MKAEELRTPHKSDGFLFYLHFIHMAIMCQPPSWLLDRYVFFFRKAQLLQIMFMLFKINELPCNLLTGKFN